MDDYILNPVTGAYDLIPPGTDLSQYRVVGTVPDPSDDRLTRSIYAPVGPPNYDPIAGALATAPSVFGPTTTLQQQGAQNQTALLAPDPNRDIAALRSVAPTGSTGTGGGPDQQAAIKSAQRSVPGASKGSTTNNADIDAPLPTSFVGQIPFFLNAVLSTPAGALPKGPLWVVIFDSFPEVVKQVKDYEPRMPDPWEIERAFDTITSPRYQSEKGCILAQSVSLPSESLITFVEGNQYNGYIRGRVGVGRQDFDLLRINFLNTNLLFVDNVIRPWTVMTGHLGMIARPKEQNYRSNITVYRLGVKDRETPPFILQQFNFWGACPIAVGSEELVYNNTTQIVKSADFTYQWYTVSSAKNEFATGKTTSNEVTVARAVDPNVPVEVRRAIPIQ